MDLEYVGIISYGEMDVMVAHQVDIGSGISAFPTIGLAYMFKFASLCLTEPYQQPLA